MVNGLLEVACGDAVLSQLCVGLCDELLAELCDCGLDHILEMLAKQLLACLPQVVS